MRRFFTWLIAIFLGMLVHSHNAFAQIDITKSYFIDEKSSYTFSDIRDKQFENYAGDLEEGIRTGTTWVKIRISKSKSFDEKKDRLNVFPLTVKVGTFVLDEIQLFEYVNGTWESQIFDHVHLQRPRICRDDSHCFKLQNTLVEPNEEVIYLRITNQGNTLIQIQVVPQEKLSGIVIDRVYSISLSITFAIGIFCLSIILYLIDRSNLNLTFMFFELSIICYLIVTTGSNYNFFQTNYFHLNFIAPVQYLNARAFIFCILCYFAIIEYKPSKTYINLTFALAGFSLFSMFIFILGFRIWSLNLVLMIQTCTGFLNIYGVLSCKEKNSKIKTILLFGYSIFLIMFLIGVNYTFQFFNLPKVDFFFHNLLDTRMNGVPIGVIVFSIVITKILESKKLFYQSIANRKINELKILGLNNEINERKNMLEILTHEIQNPLSSIRFASNTIENLNPNNSEIYSRTLVINRSISRISELINQVYLLIKVENFHESSQKVHVEIANILTNILDEFNDAERIKLLGLEKINLFTNEFLLNCILNNLISNALKYSVPHSSILVKLEEVEISIQNGILHSTKNQLKRFAVITVTNEVEFTNSPNEKMMFERFYRHENFLSKPGLGIGLSIVKTACHLLDGEIFLIKDECSLSFRIELPL